MESDINNSIDNTFTVNIPYAPKEVWEWVEDNRETIEKGEWIDLLVTMSHTFRKKRGWLEQEVHSLDEVRDYWHRHQESMITILMYAKYRRPKYVVTIRELGSFGYLGGRKFLSKYTNSGSSFGFDIGDRDEAIHFDSEKEADFVLSLALKNSHDIISYKEYENDKLYNIYGGSSLLALGAMNVGYHRFNKAIDEHQRVLSVGAVETMYVDNVIEEDKHTDDNYDGWDRY